MKKLIAYISLCLLIVSCASNKQKLGTIEQAQKQLQEINQLRIPKADKSLIKADMNYLAMDGLKGRDTGSKGISLAADYLSAQFEELGIEPFYEDYRDNFMVGEKEAFNVVAQMPGSDGKLQKEIVVIGAHYDHIGIITAVENDSIANGANDNASGTATVMAIARVLKELDFNRRTVVFALFSGEEKGLLGSKHLALRMQNEGMNVVAMLNFEMTGVPMQDKPYLTYLTGYDMSNMGEVFNSANKDLVTQKATGKLQKAADFGLFKRSDNYPFFQTMGIPAQTFCTFDFTNFEHYHQVGDEMSEINIDHMTKVVDAIMPGVLDVINESNLKMKLIDE
jgi:aminopeptidase-like protein